MDIIIKKNNKKIATAKQCKSIFLKALGFMFSRSPKKGLLFVNKFESIEFSTIHMLFVFFPIDVVWMDKNKKVVDIRRNLNPFRLRCSPKRKAKYILELKKGDAKGIKIGDKLTFS